MKMGDQLPSLLSKIRIRNQLLFTFFISILTPVIIIGTILLFNNQNLLNKHFEHQLESDNLRIKSIMFDLTTNLYNVSESLASDYSLEQILIKNYSSDLEFKAAVDSYNRLKIICQNDPAIADLNIYTLNDTISNYSHIKYADQQIQKTNWFNKASKQANVFWQSAKNINNKANKNFELVFYRKILLPEINTYAVLVINISNNYLKNRILNNSFFSMMAINKDPIFFISQNKSFVKKLFTFIDYKQEYYYFLDKVSFDNSVYLCNISTLTPYLSDDKMYIYSMDSQAYPYLYKITITFLIIITILLILPITIIYVFTKYFSSRVTTLRSAMHEVTCGNYNIINTFQGDDELSATFSDLKIMISKIKNNEAKIYQNQIREQEITNRQQQMEFKMLASQINPHFLYNTLEMIRMKALTAGNSEVSTAIKLLGKSMRYVLDNTVTASISLKKELDYIQTYLAIQKLRFHDRVNFIIEISKDIDTDDYQILPLLLQPIVENAILHGLENIETHGQIIIKIYPQAKNSINIDILDNGIGISEEKLNNILVNISKPNQSLNHNIGLYNINQRIKLCYGEKYGITIKSQEIFGTTVSLLLPFNNSQEVL